MDTVNTDVLTANQILTISSTSGDVNSTFFLPYVH
jgi:hypothetical protein